MGSEASAASAFTRPSAAPDLVRLAELPTDTPELVVDLERVDRNISRAANAAAVAGKRLRPHVKTHKLPQIAHLQEARGAAGIQVAKISEAEAMLSVGVADILVGYPIVGQAKLARLVALAREAQVSVAVDSLAVARGISDAMASSGATVTLLVEVDTGLQRVGVAPGQPAVTLAQQISALPAIEFSGVITHEGHTYALSTSRSHMRELTLEACQQVVETARLIELSGVPVRVVSVGSSATFQFCLEAAGVTEVRPGTYVFNDLSQVALGAATLDDVAAVVVATVVSGPRGNEVVVDVGSKGLSSDRLLTLNPPAEYGRTADGRGQVVRLSEEHAILRYDEDPPGVGARVAIIPNHVCPVFNLYNDVLAVSGDSVERWPVAARGALK
jgi:D-serine deaminase-like pyridoxal phosphate-dependent protein